MATFNFHNIERAVAELKVDYPPFMFTLFCESGQTGTRGIIDLGIGSVSRGYKRYTIVVPVAGLTTVEEYCWYFREMLIKDGRLPADPSIFVRPMEAPEPKLPFSG